MSVALVAWTTGIVVLLINAMQMVRKQVGKFMPNLGLVLSVILLLFAVTCVLGLDQANFIATNGDVPSGMRNNALREAKYFILGSFISVVIAVVTGGLGFYRRVQGNE